MNLFILEMSGKPSSRSADARRYGMEFGCDREYTRMLSLAAYEPE